jgi:hypothetical protein
MLGQPAWQDYEHQMMLAFAHEENLDIRQME